MFYIPQIFACPNPVKIILSPGNHEVVSIDQSQKDLTLKLVQQETGLNNALEQTGSELLFLKADDTAKTFNLCFSEKNGQVLSNPTIHRHIVNGPSKPLIDSLLKINDASRLWSYGDLANQKRATELWIEISETDFPSDLSYVKHYALLNVAAAQQIQIENQLALDTVSRLLSETNISVEMKYKAEWIKAAILVNQRNYSEAIDILSGILSTLQDNPKYAVDLGYIKNLLAIPLLFEGKVAEANELLVNALLTAPETPKLRALIHDNMGLLHIKKADKKRGVERQLEFNAAIENELIALEYFSNIDDKPRRALIESNIGTIYERMGEFQLAQSHYYRALALLEYFKSRLAPAVIYKNLGKISQYAGEYQSALSFQIESERLFGEEFPIWSMKIRCEKGTTLRLMGRLDRALEEHEKCLLFFRETDFHTDNLTEFVNALYQLAKDYFLLNQTERASTLLDEAFQYFEDLNDTDLKVEMLLLLGELNLIDGNIDAARKNAELGLALSEFSRYPTAKVNALRFMIKMLIHEKDYESADVQLDQAMRFVEEVQSLMHPQQFGPSWSSVIQDIYAQKLSLTLELDKVGFRQAEVNKIYSFIERSRMSSLRFEPTTKSDLEQEQLKQRFERLSELADLQASNAADHTQIGQFNRWRFLLKSNDISVPIADPIKELGDVQANLSENQVMLFYMFAERTLYGLLIDADKTQVLRLGIRANVEKTIADVLTSTGDPNKPFVEGLTQLSKLILPEPQTLADYEQILFVPHLSLSKVPYSALQISEKIGYYDPLISKFEVVIVPSASKYTNTSHKAEQAQANFKDVVLFSNPEFDSEPIDDTKNTLGWTNSLLPLTFSYEEAQRIKDSLPGLPIAHFKDDAANKENFFSSVARNASILHLSTHGFFNPKQPENVGFALSSKHQPNGDNSNGFVTRTELFSYEFSNQLVVLSGCETNLGSVYGGDGLQSIAKAILMGGAKNTVSTLWKVSDRSSAVFMGRLYSHLISEENIVTAMQLAKIDLFNTFRFRHPFYWAGYAHQSTGYNNLAMKKDD